jgi:hypothetical protein
VIVDVTGLSGRAPGAAVGPIGPRPAVAGADPLAPAHVAASLDGPDDARSISEPPGLTFTRAGLSPGRTSRFVADL